jgi:hypothetical protein
VPVSYRHHRQQLLIATPSCRHHLLLLPATTRLPAPPTAAASYSSAASTTYCTCQLLLSCQHHLLQYSAAAQLPTWPSQLPATAQLPSPPTAIFSCRSAFQHHHCNGQLQHQSAADTTVRLPPASCAGASGPLSINTTCCSPLMLQPTSVTSIKLERQRHRNKRRWFRSAGPGGQVRLLRTQVLKYASIAVAVLHLVSFLGE